MSPITVPSKVLTCGLEDGDAGDILGDGVAVLEPLDGRGGRAHSLTRQDEGHPGRHVRHGLRGHQDLRGDPWKREGQVI